MFKPVSARLAGPYVPNTALGPMLRPFWCNDSTTTLRTLDDWPFMHGDLSLSPTPMRGRSLKNRARLRNPHQLLLQDLSDSRAADRGEYCQAAGAFAAPSPTLDRPEVFARARAKSLLRQRALRSASNVVSLSFAGGLWPSRQRELGHRSGVLV